MQFAIFIYGPLATGEEAAAHVDRAPHNEHADEMVRDDVMIAAFALHPAAEASVSISASGERTGHFTETARPIAGFYVVEADDFEAAVALARTNPIVQQGGGVEVRAVESYFVRPSGSE